MERFIDFGIPEKDEPQLAHYKSDPAWKRIYSFLSHGYWHATKASAWKEIRKTGAIRPNIDGRYPKSFDPATERSYAYKHKCVALFDFITPTEEEVIRVWGHIWDVLMQLDKKYSILLQLDRQVLQSKILLNSEAWQRADGMIFGCIPFCEVWYPDPIPIAAITGRFQVPTTSRFGKFNPKPIRETP